jgi:hypothetical protein
MHAITRIRRSRDAWCKKAKRRGLEGCELRKEVKRQKARVHRRDVKILDLNAQIAAARAKISATNTLAIASPAVVSPEQTRARCVVLVIFAVISFRAVPRILTLTAFWFANGRQWIPHFTSVINWT